MGDDGPRGIQIFPDHFKASASGMGTPETSSSSSSYTTNEFEHSSGSHLWAKRRLRSAASILNLLSPRRLSWGNDTNGQEKVVLSSREVKSLQSELAELEEREAHLRAQLEHIDEVLRTCHLSGYLHMRTRWAALPGEPLPLDDTEIDDWLPRFVVLHGPCFFLYFLSTDLSPQDSTLLSDVVEVGPMPCASKEDGETLHYFYILTRYGLRYECSSTSKIQVDNWLTALQDKCELEEKKMTTQIFRSASRAARSFISKHNNPRLFSSGRAVAAAAAVSSKGVLPALASFGRDNSGNTSSSWIAGAFALPAAAYMLQDQEAHAAGMERTFIAIKPDGVQRGLISEIIARFERKGFKLVAIKLITPTKSFAQQHYHDLKERPFFDGLCDFLSSGPVLAMVWEGEGVIKYGRKLIGATDPQKSEPGTIRGDLAVVVGRNIIHGSDGPETAKDEINLWFKPEEVTSYTSNQEKWVYGNN
uniref:uncharacterized protein LOC122610366 isoform X2 n=1 Tax=Erigeron canadensis TaxID=72917 RepID=UPI001CB8CDD5|nr:uncharacterized protein LOC122610366 isoform X2 [Erigeron canadensis]